jgi:hypothetical protein
LPSCKVNFDASPQFRRLVTKLKREYPHIEDDLRKLFKAVETDILSNKASRLEVGLSSIEVYKYRQNSSDIRRGQSYGWRVVGLFHRETGTMYPILVYPKTHFENADNNTVMDAVREVMAFLGHCPAGRCNGVLSRTDPVETATVCEELHVKIRCGLCGTIYWKSEEWLLTANIA